MLFALKWPQNRRNGMLVERSNLKRQERVLSCLSRCELSTCMCVCEECGVPLMVLLLFFQWNRTEVKPGQTWEGSYSTEFACM